MKTNLFVALLCCCVFAVATQNPDNMQGAERMEHLQNIAQTGIQKYTPDKSEKFADPVIEHNFVAEDLPNRYFTEEDVINNLGRSYYAVKYSNALNNICVLIWGNTGKVFRIFSNNNVLYESDE